MQEFALSFGRALVFYPRYDASACEIALILDLDPLSLVGRGQRAGLPLYPYVNDRPYVASSFLSVALAEVFKSALNGHKTRPELLDHAFPFEVKLPCLPVRGNISLADLFGPLGYRLHIIESPLDTAFPEWGQILTFPARWLRPLPQGFAKPPVRTDSSPRRRKALLDR